MDKKIMVKNLSNGKVVLSSPELNFIRTWEGKDTQIPIDREKLKEAFYSNPGVAYMFEEGILYIDDMELKKDLGIEPLDAEKPVNIVILTDKQKLKYLKVSSLKELKKLVSTLTNEQVLDLVQFAIENKCTDIDKVEFLKEKTGIDIISAVKLNQADKENIDSNKRED